MRKAEPKISDCVLHPSAQGRINAEFIQIAKVVQKRIKSHDDVLEQVLVEYDSAADCLETPFREGFDKMINLDGVSNVFEKWAEKNGRNVALFCSYVATFGSKLEFQRGEVSKALESILLAETMFSLYTLEIETSTRKKLKTMIYQNAKKMIAIVGAKARHIETNKKREEIIAHWREHIYASNPKLSNEKAGEWLKDTFPELSVRKLSEYVSHAKREKKDLHPASTA